MTDVRLYNCISPSRPRVHWPQPARGINYPIAVKRWALILASDLANGSQEALRHTLIMWRNLHLRLQTGGAFSLQNLSVRWYFSFCFVCFSPPSASHCEISRLRRTTASTKSDRRLDFLWKLARTLALDSVKDVLLLCFCFPTKLQPQEKLILMFKCPTWEKKRLKSKFQE